MTDNQEDIIKKIFAFNHVKVKDVLKAMFPQGKGSYYNAVKKKPLDKAFIEGIKSHFGIDLVKEMTEYNKEGVDRIAQLERELSETRKKLNDALERNIELKDKLDEKTT